MQAAIDELRNNDSMKWNVWNGPNSTNLIIMINISNLKIVCDSDYQN